MTADWASDFIDFNSNLYFKQFWLNCIGGTLCFQWFHVFWS